MLNPLGENGSYWIVPDATAEPLSPHWVAVCAKALCEINVARTVNRPTIKRLKDNFVILLPLASGLVAQFYRTFCIFWNSDFENRFAVIKHF